MEGLSDECRAAPKYGANGRQLLLEAASRLVEEEDFVFARPAPPGFNAKKKLESAFRIRDAGALYEAIPNDEKPFVPYNPRAKLPRYNRQTSVESLTGKYLVLILELVDAAERKALQVLQLCISMHHWTTCWLPCILN
ncbi:unnamed protein product [Ostreobium quekettii]|uniref:Uncharacterized protein n=1 Tax=Ostreobium quekettii TaxID=121088 RepID=A0A8S1IVA3_9CHLO|nr:unnamed protein product [Ostreobium quekettii]